MTDAERRDIAGDLREMVEPDGYNAAEVIDDLAMEYGVARADVVSIYDEMNRIKR